MLLPPSSSQPSLQCPYIPFCILANHLLLWASLQRRRLVFGHGFYRGLLLGVQTHFARPVYSITTIQNCCAMHFPSTLRDETADLRVEAPSIEKEQAREGDFVTTDGAYQNGSSCETNNRHTYTHSNSRRSLLTGTEPTHPHTHTPPPHLMRLPARRSRLATWRSSYSDTGTGPGRRRHTFDLIYPSFISTAFHGLGGLGGHGEASLSHNTL